MTSLRLVGNAVATEAGTARVLVDGVPVGTFSFAGDVALVYGMNIPTSHPRTLLVGADLALAQAWYTAHPFSANPNEDYWGGYTENAMRAFLTQDAAAGAACVSWLMASYPDIFIYPPVGVACDPIRWTGDQGILVFDWCYQWFTPAQRSTLMAHMNNSLQAWAAEPWGGPPMYGNNYYWGYLRNELLWAIATYHENTTVANQLLAHVFNTRLRDHFNPSTLAGGDSRGGVPHEQFGYGATTGAYMAVPFLAAKALGRDVFRETDAWRELVYANIHATTPARTIVPGAATYAGLTHGYTQFPANDTEDFHERYNVPRHAYSPNFMIAAAKAFGTATVGRHARYWLDTFATEQVTNIPYRHLQSVDDGVATPLAFTALPLDYFASGAANLFARNNWNVNAAGTSHIWIQGGDFDEGTLGHMHADYGSFQFWRSASESGNVRGRYLTRETVSYESDLAGYGGSGTANANHTIGHNSILIDGASIGPQYSTHDAVAERCETQAGYAYLAMLLSPPATAAQVWRREFVFLRGIETLVIIDRLQTASAGAVKAFLLHTENAATIAGTRATHTLGASKLVADWLLPAGQIAIRNVDEGSSVYHQNRLEVLTTPGTAQSYILTVLQAMDSGASPRSPSVVDNGASYTLTLDASNAITFQKGMTSAGGSVTAAGITNSLRTTVQAMTVTDDGPAWGA